MPNNKTDRHRMARALADACHMGDSAAAKKHRISVRTLQRWRAKSMADAKLKQSVDTAADAIADEWRGPLIEFVQAALIRAKALLEQETSIDVIARAVDKLTSLDIAARVFGLVPTDGGKSHPKAAEPTSDGEAE